MSKTFQDNEPNKNRLISLDVMRGLIMILLAAESCLLYHHLQNVSSSGVFASLIRQFHHHPWHGLHFWDLVQPAFMLMAGSALYISWDAKAKKGTSWNNNFKHVLKRSLKLFLLGTALHCIYAGEMVWELWNVLTQLAITSLIAYLIIRKSFAWQMIFSLALLILTELLYRNVLLPGFNQPFVQGQNFGAYADTLMMGKINSDGWVAINFIPTAAHTIWGVLAGKLLVSNYSQYRKIQSLIISGVVLLVLGYALDTLNLTPIIKRISTSSFVLVSGGWVLLMMGFLYWLNDVKKYVRHAWIFTVVGMNAIFIYLFFETVGIQWFNNIVAIFITGTVGLVGLSKNMIAVLSALVTLIAEWYLCYWLFKRKIFFKL